MQKILITLLTIVFSLSALAATSQENRNNKNYELTFQIGGDYRLIPATLSAMYFLDKDNLVGVKVGSANANKETQTNVAIQYKHYGTNSFYVAGETFYLNTREDVNDGLDGILKDSEYARYQSLGAGIRIGNQWTWSHFTLGCDWVGVGYRFGEFKKETDALDEVTFTLLNVIIGASF